MRKCDLMAVLTAVSVAAIGFSGPVFAHAKLLSTVPAANSQVAAAPATLALQFDEAVKLAKFELMRGSTVVPIALDPNAAPAAKYDVALPALQPGNYTVTWSALTVDDGHVVHGSFKFVLQAPAVR